MPMNNLYYYFPFLFFELCISLLFKQRTEMLRDSPPNNWNDPGLPNQHLLSGILQKVHETLV